MHRVLSVGSLEVTDKAQQPKGVSLDALVAAAIRGVAALLAFASRDELLDTTLELYHGCVCANVSRRGVERKLWGVIREVPRQGQETISLTRPGDCEALTRDARHLRSFLLATASDADMYWDLPAMIKDLDGAAASEALWDATVASNGGVEWGASQHSRALARGLQHCPCRACFLTDAVPRPCVAASNRLSPWPPVEQSARRDEGDWTFEHNSCV
jgi:hypothetical protein